MDFQSLSLGSNGELESWARRQTATDNGLEWWETAAAAGSSLGVHALIAAAASPMLDEQDVAAIEAAYFPWIGALHSLLDSLVDSVLFNCTNCVNDWAKWNFFLHEVFVIE